MLGEPDRQVGFVMLPSLRSLLPEDYILVRVDAVLDLSWLRAEVSDLYSADNGRPSIPPESMVRLMLAGYFHDIVHDRELIREAAMHIGIRWFAGFDLTTTLPHHSTLTYFRRRLGAERFRRIFLRTVQSCVEKGLAPGLIVHVDATLIRADVSWQSLVTQYAERTLSENDEADDRDDGPSKPIKRSRTDPDATMATSRRDQRLEPSYKQHAVVDDERGVILEVEVTTGAVSEGAHLLDALDRAEENAGISPERVTADSGYAHAANYRALEERGIDAVIPPQRETRRKTGTIPTRRFRYDEVHDVVRCPAKNTLRPTSRVHNGRIFRAHIRDCRDCPLRTRCVPRSAKIRTILIVDGYPALMRARRRWARWGGQERYWYERHRWRSEGMHGEAKTRHGLDRAVRRGLANVRIQAYLTAAVINLKRLAKAFLRLRSLIRRLLTVPKRRLGPVGKLCLMGLHFSHPPTRPVSPCLVT